MAETELETRILINKFTNFVLYILPTLVQWFSNSKHKTNANTPFALNCIYISKYIFLIIKRKF